MTARIPRPRLLAALMIAALAAACGNDTKNAAAPKGPAGSAPPPPEVAVMAVSYGDATLTQDLPGRLQAWRTAQVRARVEGIVEKREFTEGSDVQAGQVLYRIDPRTYQTAFDAAKADVAAARLLVDRYKPLLEIKAVSQQDFDTASARLKQAEAALARAQLDLENTRVPAPIAGRIGRSSVTAGALVTANQASALATVQQLDPIYVDVTQTSAEMLRLQRDLSEGRLQRAGDGQAKVKLLLEDGSTYAQEGKLQFSELSVDTTSGSVTLRAVFPNPKRLLLPGMYVRAVVENGVSEQGSLVPQAAVSRDAKGNATALVLGTDGKVQARTLQTTQSVGKQWLVSSGLKAGDKLIVDGLQKVQPGAAAQGVEASASAAAAAASAASAN
jgi:membrane fusion protein (multidrug efflux system)